MKIRNRNLQVLDGNQYAECDRCGGHYPGDQLRKTWDNFMLCQFDWYPEPSFVQMPIMTPNEGGNTLTDPRPTKTVTFQTVAGPDPVMLPYLDDYFGDLGD